MNNRKYDLVFAPLEITAGVIAFANAANEAIDPNPNITNAQIALRTAAFFSGLGAALDGTVRLITITASFFSSRRAQVAINNNELSENLNNDNNAAELGHARSPYGSNPA